MAKIIFLTLIFSFTTFAKNEKESAVTNSLKNLVKGGKNQKEAPTDFNLVKIQEECEKKGNCSYLKSSGGPAYLMPKDRKVKKKTLTNKNQIAINEIKEKFLKSDMSGIPPRMVKDITLNFSKRSAEDFEEEEDEPCQKIILDVIHDRYMSDRCNTIIYKSPRLKRFAVKNKKCSSKILPLGKGFMSGELRVLMNHTGKELAVLWYLDNC